MDLLLTSSWLMDLCNPQHHSITPVVEAGCNSLNSFHSVAATDVCMAFSKHIQHNKEMVVLAFYDKAILGEYWEIDMTIRAVNIMY